MTRRFDAVVVIASLVLVAGVLLASAADDWPDIALARSLPTPPDATPVVCPVPADAVCWCVSARDDKVFVQEITRPKLPETAKRKP